jgi:hypothetical protein
MGPDSKILLDEMVLPNTGVGLWSAGQDLQMMLMLGAVERTEDEWRDLVSRAGLKVAEIRTYAPVEQTSILVIERA